MSVDKQKTLLKIRTFAQDLKTNQPVTGQPATEETLAKKDSGAVFETPKMAAPAVSKHTVTVEKKAHSEPNKIIEERKTEPKKIPAFHELQKKVSGQVASESIKPDQVKPKVKVRAESKKGRRLSTTTASIITDTKKSEAGFFARLSKSFSLWLNSVKKSKKKKSPQYTVQDTTRRKGVIQKATTKTGTLFTADNETLRDAIQRRRAQEALHKQEEVDITWTPNTDPGYALIEAPGVAGSRVKNVQVSFKKQSVPPPVIIEPTPSKWEQPEVSAPTEIQETPTITPPQVIETREEVPVTATPERTPQPSQQAEPEVSQPAREAESAIPEADVAPVDGSIEVSEEVGSGSFTEAVEDPQFTQRPYSQISNFLRGEEKLININTNTIVIAAAALIVGIIILVLVAQVIMGLVTDKVPVTEITTESPILTTSTSVDIPLQSISNSSMLQAIAQSDSVANSPLTEVRFVTSDNQEIPTQTILGLFNFDTNPNLNRSITKIRILSIKQTERAILFTTTDATTAFGALLAWEARMQDELTPILDLSSPTETSRFVDGTIGERDVRILKAGGKEVLVYGFLNPETVLITTSTDSFTTIAIQQ